MSERFVAASGIVAVTLLCWAWIAPMARDMHGSTTGLSRWMMTSTWDAPDLLVIAANTLCRDRSRIESQQSIIDNQSDSPINNHQSRMTLRDRSHDSPHDG